jgi:hypothetical protein
MKFIATFEIDFTKEEVDRFKNLSSQLSMSFPDTVRMCANDKAEELLVRFEQGPPVNEKENNGSSI